MFFIRSGGVSPRRGPSTERHHLFVLNMARPHEIALNGSVARVRDSMNRTKSVVAAPEWAAFNGAIKRDDFEKNQRARRSRPAEAST
jgi:hypothetical protein